MVALLGMFGLMLGVIGSVGLVMSPCLFWQEAIQKNRRWVWALIGPPLAAVACWGTAFLLLVLAGHLPATWQTLVAFVRTAAFVLAVCGWWTLYTIPPLWIACAVLCWPAVHRTVYGWLLSLGALGVSLLAMYAATEWLWAF